MRSDTGKRDLRFLFLSGLVLVFSLFVSPAGAQTKKPKKPTSKPKTVTVAKPPATEPEIISRAEDYPPETLGGSQIIDPQTSTTEQPLTVDERLANTNKRVKEMSSRIKNLESGKANEYDEKQKRLLLNLDILTRAEQRAESLRKQLFEMVEKESSIKTKLDQIENDIRPEVIERQVAFAGTLRPEELREMKRKNLDIERKNLQALALQIQSTRANLEANVLKADLLVDKLRAKLEKDIDDALVETPKDDN
jgi:hypothetical protein